MTFDPYLVQREKPSFVTIDNPFPHDDFHFRKQRQVIARLAYSCGVLEVLNSNVVGFKRL